VLVVTAKRILLLLLLLLLLLALGPYWAIRGVIPDISRLRGGSLLLLLFGHVFVSLLLLLLLLCHAEFNKGSGHCLGSTWRVEDSSTCQGRGQCGDSRHHLLLLLLLLLVVSCR
jgi:hypothetical protein